MARVDLSFVSSTPLLKFYLLPLDNHIFPKQNYNMRKSIFFLITFKTFKLAKSINMICYGHPSEYQPHVTLLQ